MSLHWLTRMVFGLQDTLSLLTAVNSLLIRCTAAEQLLNLVTQFTLVLTQCLPSQTRIGVTGTGGTRLKKRFSHFNTLNRASGCAINSDRQCVPQLVFPLHRPFCQQVTELQNVPTAMAIFMARPIKLFSQLRRGSTFLSTTKIRFLIRTRSFQGTGTLLSLTFLALVAPLLMPITQSPYSNVCLYLILSLLITVFGLKHLP